jgi:hypothetical protein
MPLQGMCALLWPGAWKVGESRGALACAAPGHFRPTACSTEDSKAVRVHPPGGVTAPTM